MLFIQNNLRSDMLDKIMLFFTYLGKTGLVWIVPGIILLFFKKHRKYGIMLLISLIITYIFGEFILKNLIGRVRPFYMIENINVPIAFNESSSFPSVHAATSFASFWIILKFNKTLGWVALLIASLIAFSRVYLFAHYPTDILGGAILGILCAWIVLTVHQKFFENKIY